MTTLQIGCDIGGTFTDVVAVDSTGLIFAEKADTTPQDLCDGLLQALENLAGAIGIDMTSMLSRTTRFVNGTTVVTNAIAELKGARVGLITTRGFGDSLLIARSPRNGSRDLHQQTNLPQIVPRDRVVEVNERVDRKGAVVVALSEHEARHAVEELVALNVEAIAISLMWSFLSPAHEELLASMVQREYPQLFLSVSSRLHPVIREYERTMTTVLNAFTGLRVAEYTSRVETELVARGLMVPVAFMQGFGGTLSAPEARSRPITLVNSGPAGGVIGAQAMAKRLGISDIVTADMGGTSFDVSVLNAGKRAVTQRVMLRGQFLTAVSQIDILPIGAGGGSIAWLDARGVPQAGPQSAGADPGPVCYGKGGMQPTVTDAVSVLGLIDAGQFLGGRRQLDIAAAGDSLMDAVGNPLRLTDRQAASAIYRVVTANMANAVRAVTVERGRDPRQFALCCYGGAVGVFAADIARGIGIRTVVIPANAAVFSALGLLASDDVRTQSRSAWWTGGDATQVSSSLRQLDGELVAALGKAGYPADRIDVSWEGDFKFLGQQWELTVPIPRREDLSSSDLADIQRQFPTLYEAEYGKGSAWLGTPVVLMSVRVVATGRAERHDAAPKEITSESQGVAPVRRRPVWQPLSGREMIIDIYDAHDLAAGSSIDGPIIIEHPLTTIQVPEDWRLDVDEWSNYVLVDTSADRPPTISGSFTSRGVQR